MIHFLYCSSNDLLDYSTRANECLGKQRFERFGFAKTHKESRRDFHQNQAERSVASVDNSTAKCYHKQRRLGVAQFGSVLDWGSRGRRFKSYHPDQNKIWTS